MENPIRSNRYYAKIKRSLRKFVKFSFRNRTKFTGPQKSAITRAWNVYGGFVRDETKGHKFKVIKVSRGQRLVLRGRYQISNRGLIISSDAGIPKIPDKISHVKLINKLIKSATKKRNKRGITDYEGENLLRTYSHFEQYPLLSQRWIVVTQKKMLLDIFFPIEKGEMISELANSILTLLLPNSIHLAVNKSRGTTPYTPDTWEGYRATLVYVDKKIRKESDEQPFKGVHASWVIFKKEKTK